MYSSLLRREVFFSFWRDLHENTLETNLVHVYASLGKRWKELFVGKGRPVGRGWRQPSGPD